ncbi:uncharacterized protein LTR77_009738 [Saxophila tyrrhenica]|uniref:GPI anchored cell wall protein n=1 Tax=Saxophila tyrrhenica TaxID=1690608 RepID=A0AAV9NX72_9PEZI|nr:hypothetical protein LTR77_009738 [Saxophila tyrrhenica]
MMRTAFCLLSILASVASAQNASVDVFMPIAFENTIQFAASVIGVCQDKTTYGIRCTSGTLASAVTCGPDFPESTITEDASTYIASRTTAISSAVIAYTETCNLQGTTADATCTTTVSISGTKTTTVTSTTSVLAATWIPDFYMYQIPVTAGVQKLHATGSACSGASSHALPAWNGALAGVAWIVLLAIL